MNTDVDALEVEPFGFGGVEGHCESQFRGEELRDVRGRKGWC